jgi:hypothetical protein
MLATAGMRESSTSSCPRIWLEIPIHPAVLRERVDLVGCKGVLKHSLLKERKERITRGIHPRGDRKSAEGIEKKRVA